jgi:hypothetical protein
MIDKISQLKNTSTSDDVKALCNNAIDTISSTIYNGVTPDAKHEIEGVIINNLFEGLSNHTSEKCVKEWLETQKRLYTVQNLGVRESISSLRAANEIELNEVLEAFKDLLDKNIHEVLLYEQYITALSPFSYFPVVDNAIKAIENRVNLYKTDVDILKIIETMKGTRSNYLVPLIETVVNNYLANKNEQTKHQLTETLVKFTYDQFVRDLMTVVSFDVTELQLEYANAECDIKKIYSPVLYIGENEAVFSVNKTYYAKKGNNVNRLSKTEVVKLDPEFRALCEILNDQNVIVNKDGITLYHKNDKSIISENNLSINDKNITPEEFQSLVDLSEMSGKGEFLRLVEFVRSNFSEIAEVDFVKRVYLKEDENHAADIFKLRDNVFITTHNPKMGKSTFYRNINPIQAKGIMMEHLRFDVTSLFEGLLPDEEKILAQVEETKNAYRDYIGELEEKINKFNDANYGEGINEQVVEALEEEIKDVKDEFKDYLNSVEKYVRPHGLDESITIDINIDGKKYTVPIPQEVDAEKEKGEEGEGEEAGAVVGAENVEDQPASAITFGDEDTELLGDTPTIPEDEVDLDSEGTEEEAEDAEKEKEEKDAEEEEEELKDETEEKGDDIKIEDETDIEDEDEDELKADDDEEEEEKFKKKKKEQPLESAEGQGLKKTSFVKEAGEVKKKKKVFLKRKIRESTNTPVVKEKKNLNSKTNKSITQILKEQLGEDEAEGAEEIENGDIFSRRFRLRDRRIVDIQPDQTFKFVDPAVHAAQIAQGMWRDMAPDQQPLAHPGMHQQNEPGQIIELQPGDEEGVEEIEGGDVFDRRYRLRDGRVVNVSADGTIRLVNESVNEEFHTADKWTNKAVQLGDTVMFNKQKGFVIGQIGGDVIVQVQGNTFLTDPKNAKVMGPKVETIKPPFKFSKDTLKLLFEQYVKCGIYLENTPIKVSDCYVRYSDWKEAKDIDPISVVIEGQQTLLPKQQIRIFEDVNDFANLDNYVEGVIIDESSGEAIENVSINVVDYTQALGDADPVRIIRRGETENPNTDTVPKATLRTLAV